MHFRTTRTMQNLDPSGNISENAYSDNWQKSPLLFGLSPKKMDKLSGFIKHKSVKKGEVIFKEQDKGDGIFIIQKGEVQIYKEEGFVLAILGEGKSFGGISTFSRKPRSASARASEDTELAWLDKASLDKLSKGGIGSISNKILNNYLGIQRQTQERSDNKIIWETKKQLETAKEQIEFGTFFVSIVFFVSLYAFAIRSGADWIDSLMAKTYLTVGLLIVMLVVVGISMRNSQYTLDDYGFNTDAWRQKVPEALLWTLGFIVFATGLKYILIHTTDSYQGQELLSFVGYKNVGVTTAALTTILYCIFAPVQEFLARGLTQSSLSRFLKGKHINTKAILITTLLFSTTHLHLNTYFALAVIIPSIFWGIMYARQKSLLGVSISHIIIGIYVAFIMGGLE